MRVKSKINEIIKEKNKNASNEFTTREAAKLLGVSVTAIIAWIKAEKIKCTRTLGGHRRISINEIERVEAEMKNVPFENKSNPKIVSNNSDSKYPINKFKNKNKK